MSIDHTRQDIAKLRVDYAREPRVCALRLAQKLSWHSMELALNNEPDASEAMWTEALEVASKVLTGNGPTQFERTELIRIAVGATRSMVHTGRAEQALNVIADAERQYQALAESTVDPVTPLALRGAILTARAEVQTALGDTVATIDSLCEATLELLAGSETNPLIVRSMLREPLTLLHGLLSSDEEVTD